MRTPRLVAYGAVLALTLALTAGLGIAQAPALKIFMVPKFTGAPYFVATQRGAEQAVAEFATRGVPIDFEFTGPTVANTDEEIRIIDDLIAQRPDALIVSANDAQALIPVLQKAKGEGIPVVTYDADVADPGARDFFVNQATFRDVGATLIDVIAEEAGCNVQAEQDPNCTVKYAIVSADPEAFNQNSWIEAMKRHQAQKYPNMQLLRIEYGYDRPAESFQAAQALISAFRGELQAIIAPTSVALPRVAEAVEQAGLAGQIIVTGLATPNDTREFVKRGTIKTVVLWNPVDLGYLAVYGAVAAIKGEPYMLQVGDRTFLSGGALGVRELYAEFEDITAEGPAVLKNVVILGPPFRFTAENIDQFDF